MKKLVAVIINILLSMMIAVPVMADTISSDVQVVGYTGYFSPSGGAVENASLYSLSVNKRYADGSFLMPEDRTMTLKSITTDLSNLTAEMKTESGKKDIRIKVTEATEREAKLTINFSSKWVSTTLNSKECIIIKSNGVVQKEIPFAYSTPYVQDEHDFVTNSLSQWSGIWGSYGGDNFKYSGLVDVYQKAPVLTYTYTAQGNQGVKAFHLNPDGNFTFMDGNTTYTRINHNPKASNKIQIKCKASYVANLKSDAINSLKNYGITSNQTMMFDDFAVEYEDGCIFGGANDPILLGHEYTMRPIGTISTSTAKRSTTAIRIKWKKLESVSGYKIYRSTKKNSGYKLVKTVSNQTTSYANKKLKKSKRYYYKVRAYRNVYYQRGSSTYKTVVYGTYSTPMASATRPGKAQVTVKKKGKKIKITNKRIVGASGYRFYIKKGKNGKYKRVKQYTGSKKRTYTSKKLKKGTYYVTIRAYKQVNGKKYFGSCAKRQKVRIK